MALYDNINKYIRVWAGEDDSENSIRKRQLKWMDCVVWVGICPEITITFGNNYLFILYNLDCI